MIYLQNKNNISKSDLLLLFSAATMATPVLVLPFPAQGHINPALAFATRLASMSLSVTVLITSDLISKANVSSSSVSIACISDGKEFVEGEESFKRITSVLSANLAESSTKAQPSSSSTTPRCRGPWTWPGPGACSACRFSQCRRPCLRFTTI